MNDTTRRTVSAIIFFLIVAVCTYGMYIYGYDKGYSEGTVELQEARDDLIGTEQLINATYVLYAEQKELLDRYLEHTGVRMLSISKAHGYSDYCSSFLVGPCVRSEEQFIGDFHAPMRWKEINETERYGVFGEVLYATEYSNNLRGNVYVFVEDEKTLVHHYSTGVVHIYNEPYNRLSGFETHTLVDGVLYKRCGEGCLKLVPLAPLEQSDWVRE